MSGRPTGDILEAPNFRQIFDLAVAHHIQNRPLTVADVTKELHRTASSVHYQVDRLQKEGLISLEEAPARGRYVRLSTRGIHRADLLPRHSCSQKALSPSSGSHSATPVFSATCGRGRYASGEFEYLAPHHLFPKYRDGDRIIIAEGDSMVAPLRSPDAERSIYDSDLVWAREMEPETNARVYVEYALASGERECTIKCYQFDPLTGMVTLKPFNHDYPNIIRPQVDVEVHAVVLGVRRLLGGDRK